MSQRLPRGFTLIEVLIALLVIALGVGALLSTLTSSADTVARLRDKSLAEWVALNRISEVRLSNARPGVGVTTGTLDNFADGRWGWRQTITDPGMAGILRVEVQVMHRAVADSGEPATSSSAASETDDKFPALATAYGFLGSAVAPATGVDPDWSIAAAGGGGGPGTDGKPGGGGDGGSPGGAPKP
jgi:general secretion pathway protein I